MANQNDDMKRGGSGNPSNDHARASEAGKKSGQQNQQSQTGGQHHQQGSQPGKSQGSGSDAGKKSPGR